MDDDEVASGLGPKAWELYRACFKEGDEVILMDDDDTFYWGKLETHETFCRLHRSHKRPTDVNWNKVVFMSHDGFPVKRIRESSAAAKALERVNTANVRAAVRKVLSGEECGLCGVIVEEDSLEWNKWEDATTGKFVGRMNICSKCQKGVVIRRGDPWEIEAAWAKLWNPGRSAPEHWMDDHEEIIVAQSADGAYAHIWDVRTIFDFEEVA